MARFFAKAAQERIAALGAKTASEVPALFRAMVVYLVMLRSSCLEWRLRSCWLDQGRLQKKPLPFGATAEPALGSGQPAGRPAAAVDFKLFRDELEGALNRAERTNGGRSPYDCVLMFKVWVLQTLYTLSDDQTEFQLRDPLSFMRFSELVLGMFFIKSGSIIVYRWQHKFL
jgi:hypothetical protein